MWLAESGPHQAGISGVVTGREQEIVRDRTLRAHFALMVYLLSAGYYRIEAFSERAG